MDNVSSHSPDFKDKFSNIKVVFLPVNTTSRLQPLDAGIIKNFKVHYRKSLVKHTLTTINDGSDENASSICKSVNVLLAIQWIKQAWDSVTADTIRNCFRRCGALPRSEDESGDPFSDLDSEANDMTNLNELVQQINCDVTAEDYINAEEDLDTCLTFDQTEANWREKMCTAVVSDSISATKRPCLEEVSSDEEEEEEKSSIQSYDTALTLAQDLLLFLVSKGEEKAAEAQQNVISSLHDAKLMARMTNVKQTSLMNFLKKN